MDYSGNFSLKIRTFVLVLISFIIINGNYIKVSAQSLEDGKMKRVLFISSYSPVFNTFFQQIDGISESFEGEEIELDIEFMDSKRFYTKDNIENFYKSIEYKIKNLPSYDAVIVGDDNALDFAKEHEDKLFKDIPIIFFGINDKEKAEKYREDINTVGITEEVSIKETIEAAVDMKKDTKRIVAITDGTTSGQGDLKEFYKYKELFDGIEFSHIDLTYLDFQEFQDELHKLKKTDSILLLSVFRDKNNEIKSFQEGLDLVIDNTEQPVFQPYYHGVGSGVVGGKVVSHFEQGKKAGSITLNLLNGIDVNTNKNLKEDTNRYIFDREILDKYNFRKKDLPEDSIIINDKSIDGEYLKHIIYFGIFCVFQTVLILVLYTNIKRRRKYEKDLIEKNQEQEGVNEELRASLDEIKEQDEKIRDLIYVDPVTGLNNRFSISQIIDQAIMNYQDKEVLGVAFLDIDSFKNINDSYGHDVGDKVLNIIGDRVNKIRESGMQIGKFGGDEFLILIEKKKSLAEVEEVINSIQNIFSEQINIDNNRVILTISTGIAVMPYNGYTRSELVKNADMALGRAKESGKNKYVFFDEKMNHDMQEKMRFQENLKIALKNDEFTLNYQPYIDTITRGTSGFEALLRWHHHEYGYVSPCKIVANAEEMGLMVELGEWVMRKACKFAKKINHGNTKKLKMSINVSATQLMSDGFYKRTMGIIEETGVDPELINLEMTESILIESLEMGTKVIEELKTHGIQISLDDFGTGYSSLRYFKELPVNVLKIDKSFIDNIETSEYDQKLISGMIKIAHYKNISVISEGVESKGQYEKLRDYGCDCIQGYLFSKPLSEEKTIEYIETMEEKYVQEGIY